MTSPDAWQELTEFNSCEPSELAFRALVALLDTWPDSDQAEAIAYADRLLSHWPDAVRVASWAWCKAAAKGIVLPTWQLVRSLQLKSLHLTKQNVDLFQLAQRANLQNITELEIHRSSHLKELSLLYHRPELFTGLKRLRATDKYDDGDVRAIAASPLWRSLERFDTESMTEAFNFGEPSRIVPRLDATSPIRHLSLRGCDLMSVWDQNQLPGIRSVSLLSARLTKLKR